MEQEKTYGVITSGWLIGDLSREQANDNQEGKAIGWTDEHNDQLRTKN